MPYNNNIHTKIYYVPNVADPLAPIDAYKYVPACLSFFSRLMIALIGIRWRLNARKTVPSDAEMIDAD